MPSSNPEQLPQEYRSQTQQTEPTQSTLTFVGEHEGVTVAFIGMLILLVVYLYKDAAKIKKDKSDVVIKGLHEALEQQRETLDSTLGKLDATVGKLEKTITDLAAELFRDMHSLDRRLSKLEGEHSAQLRMNRRSDDCKEDCDCGTVCEGTCG